MAPNNEDLPSLRDLASSDPKVRRAAQQTTFTHIATRTSALTPTQALQLWRGLFVTLLMHDSKNQLSVQRLVVTLASQFEVVARRDDERSGDECELSTFTKAFWETVSREWSGVDQYRVDKVLLLIRLAVRELFTICLSSDTSTATATTDVISQEPLLAHDPRFRQAMLLASQTKIFETWPLSPRERKVPDGLRYHVLDVWVDELAVGRQHAEGASAAENRTDEDVESEAAQIQERIKVLLRPVERIAKEGLNKGVRTRAKDVLGGVGEKLGLADG